MKAFINIFFAHGAFLLHKVPPPVHRLYLQVLMGLLLVGSHLACSPKPVDRNDQTVVQGEIYGLDFSQASAGYKIDDETAVKNFVIRIAPRNDVCSAILDPSDDLSPSIIITTSGDQAQSYDVIALSEDPNQHAGATASVLLQTTIQDCNGDVDAGSVCQQSRSATAGKIVIEEAGQADDIGTVRGAFGATFDNDNAIEGHFIAKKCSRIY